MTTTSFPIRPVDEGAVQPDPSLPTFAPSTSVPSPAPTTTAATTSTATAPTTISVATVPTTASSGGGDADGSDGVALGAVIALALIVAVVAASVGVVLGRLARRAPESPPAPPPAPPPPAPAPLDGALAAVAGERAQLVEVLIDTRDRLGAGALADRLGAALASVGVATIDPVGERFDPNRHWAQGADRLTNDASLDNTVAEAVTVGYTDHGRPHRLPGVVVYRRARTEP